MGALDDLLRSYNELHGGETRAELDARAELADLRARALPAEIVDAVRAYQEAYLTLQGLKGVDEKRKIEWQRSKGYNEIGTKRALFRAIEADAKGGG